MIGVVGVGVAVVAVNYGGCHYVLMWNVGALIFLMFVGVCFFKSASMMWMIVVVKVTKIIAVERADGNKHIDNGNATAIQQYGNRSNSNSKNTRNLERQTVTITKTSALGIEEAMVAIVATAVAGGIAGPKTPAAIISGKG